MIRVVHKSFGLLIVVVLMLCVASCEFTQQHKPYSIYWYENNLCVVIPFPTSETIELGKMNWDGVDLNQVVSYIFYECNNSERSGDVTIWVRFENPQTDKYGNVTMAYDDFEIATIPLSEARKYKSGRFLDAEYKLTDGIRNAAFGSRDNVNNYDECLKSQNNGTKHTVRAIRSSDIIELDYIAPNQYIAPTDTLDF